MSPSLTTNRLWMCVQVFHCPEKPYNTIELKWINQSMVIERCAQSTLNHKNMLIVVWFLQTLQLWFGSAFEIHIYACFACLHDNRDSDGRCCHIGLIAAWNLLSFSSHLLFFSLTNPEHMYSTGWAHIKLSDAIFITLASCLRLWVGRTWTVDSRERFWDKCNVLKLS